MEKSTFEILSMTVQITDCRKVSLLKIGPVVITVPPNTCSFAPADEAGELDEELELAAEEVLDFLLDPVSNRDEGEDEVSAVGGDEVRESGGEHVGTVADGAAAPVNELQFLAEIEGEEAREEEARMISGCHDVKLL